MAGPGSHIIWYQLLDGDHAGDVIYVAEHLRHMTGPGTASMPDSGSPTRFPAIPYIEMGWADSYGSPRAYPCYKEGRRTNSGKEMARFLGGIGADVGGDRPGWDPVTDRAAVLRDSWPRRGPRVYRRHRFPA